MLAGKRILLIIGSGLEALEALTLIRLIRSAGGSVLPVLTRAAADFVTPRAVATLAGEAVIQQDAGAAAFGPEADLVVVAPADAGIIAAMAQGEGPVPGPLTAGDRRLLIVPVRGEEAGVQRDLAALRDAGMRIVSPGEGGGEMARPEAILCAIGAALAGGPLHGRHVLVTSGPTHEPIDPVRYIANRSSGQQGTALAAALRDLGAQVTFVTGPATTPPPPGVSVVKVETAREMLAAVEAALPADAAVFAAAVADWRVKSEAGQKLKKQAGAPLPVLEFLENPDILATISRHAQRPPLVVGFAAETETVVVHAQAKRLRKGCDWIVANDVSPATGIMGGAENAVHLITETGVEDWPRLPKPEVARRLATRIAEELT
ncbi:MAG: bifunctional phosphopantothenoylcysteine decarboxylase/phosphopantothenate--cysteine ligase CoaBC [Pararhodobacter sp.]